MALLTVQNLEKNFPRERGDASGLHGFDLEVERSEFVTLLGPSGCGKTTTLRCIAGLETPDDGRIVLDGKTLFASQQVVGRRAVNVPPELRGIAMVFQDYALWPHMDVFQNVAFGLQGAHRSRLEVSADVERALRSVRLWDHRQKRISQLSGGQQQRVALARAMAPKPKIILFDEPLSNLDTRFRDDMRLEILELQRNMGLTVVWVTHDQDEALGMSTRIVLMNEGRIEQTGSPIELWTAPASGFAAQFLGSTNRLSGTVVKHEGGSALALSIGEAFAPRLPDRSGLSVGEWASIYVRPGAIRLVDASLVGRPNVWPATVLGQTFHGEYAVLSVMLGTTQIKVRIESYRESLPSTVAIHVDPSATVAFRDGV